MFFCKTNRQSCQTLKDILKQHEEASGQMINCQKSAITFSSKTPQEIKARVKGELAIPRKGGLGKGLPEHFG